MDELLSYRYATKEYVQARIAEAMAYAGGGGSTPVLITKNITANGVYSAADDNADGYSSVDVNVPGVDLSSKYAACVREGTNGNILHCYGQNILTNTYTYAADITKVIIEPTVTYVEGSPSSMNNLTTVEGCEGIETIFAIAFSNCPNLSSPLNFPKCTSLGGTASQWFKNDTQLTSVTIGSVGYGLTIESQPTMAFQGCTQAGLTITFYCTGANVDTNLTKIRNGATNATIVVKASEATTYGGNSFAAGDTILTSTP